MDKTAVEDFADLAGRARADLKVLENRRDAAREREESNRNINSRSGERECNTAMGKVLALNSAITNMRYFAKALGEAHAREVCRDLKAMPAEEKYGQPCKCGDDLCGYWYCKCPLRSNVSKNNYCQTCYLHNPHLREEEGKWCEATRKWTCKCYVGKNWACCGHVFHHTTTGKCDTTTDKCSMCNMVNPCPAPKPKEVTKYGEWCDCSNCMFWKCGCEDRHLSPTLSRCKICFYYQPDRGPIKQVIEYGKWCMCVPKCNSWLCGCDFKLHINCVGSCDKCKARRPIEPKPVYGEWCSCGCGQWRCDCDQHGVKSRRLSTTSKCSKCNHLKPKESL